MLVEPLVRHEALGVVRHPEHEAAVRPWHDTAVPLLDLSSGRRRAHRAQLEFSVVREGAADVPLA